MGNEDRQFVWFPAGGLPGAAEVRQHSAGPSAHKLTTTHRLSSKYRRNWKQSVRLQLTAWSCTV